MNITISFDEKQVMALLAAHIEKETGVSVEPTTMSFEVKTKQNYRAEWERGQFRVTVHTQVKPS